MDNKLFRSAMGKFATGVTVITTSVDNKVYGMTANAFMSISLEPKLVTISVDNRANILDKIETSGRYAVSILSEEQQDVSMHFAGQKEKEDGVLFDYHHDIPIVKDPLAYVVCDVYDTHVVGDHTLFIGKVKEINLRDGKPLSFYQGKYGSYEQFNMVK